MRFQVPALALLLCGMTFLPVAVDAQTIKGQTVLSSYLALGQCAEVNSAGALSAAVCTKKKEQDIRIEIFNDSARYVSWQKIMNGKRCLEGRYKPDKNNLYFASCAITTWSNPAFWRFLGFGHMRSEDNYCVSRKDGNLAVGALFTSDTCNYFALPDLYPALLTRSAKVGPQTLASYKGNPVKAIVIENGYSGGNLVASEGALLKIDGGGNVEATNGGYIIAGGSGTILKSKFAAADSGAVVIAADLVDKAPDDHSPSNLDFFTEKHARGELNYRLH